jgi:hypothetical protein
MAMIIPIKYSFKGGYNNSLYCFANVSILYFCKISALYNIQDPFVKLKILGFTININPDTFIEKNKKKSQQEHKEINKEKPADSGSMDIHILKKLFQKDIIFHVLGFLKDLIGILKPKTLMLKGKIGFYEPHHTAWLQAIVSTVSALNIFTNLNIDTVWDDEHFEGELIVEGKLAVIVLLFRMLKFIISRNTLKVIQIIIKARKKKKILKPAT